ncbi:MAG: bifunctional riboflavin kinase/FAD synthetase [Defluviitaleaceae bacterium]|nr:bifunctional riboflavin kinase/FAD synthetase [Defluviitaleaceae bacterium]
MIYLNSENIQQNSPTVITIGNFDGVHIGHKQLIKTAVDYAKKNRLQSLVFSFNPHPKTVLMDQSPGQIFVSSEKASVFKEMGVDIFLEYPFSKELAEYSPHLFLEKILIDLLKCTALVLGENSRLGKGRKADIAQIKEIAKEYNINVFVESLLKDENGGNISSTKVREALLEGNIKNVNAMLGHSYFLSGTVLTGDRRGSKIGFPTANIQTEPSKILPKNGVYITTTTLPNGSIYPSVTNVGIHPTFKKEGMSVIIETFILDFNQDLYGKKIEVKFLEHIRGEKKFDGINELIAEINKDVQQARKYSYL